jgi:protein YIPF6
VSFPPAPALPLFHLVLAETPSLMIDRSLCRTAMSQPHPNGRGDTILLHPSSAHSDMDEIKDLINVGPSPAAILPAALPASTPRTSIPVFSASSAPTAASYPVASGSGSVAVPIGSDGFRPETDTLIEYEVADNTVEVTYRQARPQPHHQQPHARPSPTPSVRTRARRSAIGTYEGAFFFIVFLSLIVSSATVTKVLAASEGFLN